MNRCKQALACLLAAVTLCLTACGKGPAPDTQPFEVKLEKADNYIHARYTFTLRELTEMLEDAIKVVHLRPDGWQLISAGLIDDSGTPYSSYYYQTGEITLTAAVENQSREVLNIGCGCQKERLTEEDFRDSFTRLMAVAAAQAGGYTEQSADFLQEIFIELLDGEDKELYYEQALYICSEDDDTVMLMISPAADRAAVTDDVKDYQPKPTE